MAVPSHAERARTLAASRKEGTLSTLAREPLGHPFGSYVEYALIDGAPTLLISALAEHTQNLERDPRASLLIVEGERAGETALARGRVTLLGTCARAPDRAKVEDAFLARHPSAKMYAGFRDFAYWQLEVESARYVGGFGRMSWIDRDAWTKAEVDPLLDAAEGILTHMNDDHADACTAYARVFGSADASAARMIAVDRYGFDLAVTTGEGPRSLRIAFPAPVTSANEVRKALSAMVREARAKLG